MTTYQYHFHIHFSLPPFHIAAPIATLGALAVGHGIRTVRDPQANSNILGIPIVTSSSEELLLISLLGARNITFGCMLLDRLFAGKRGEIGTILGWGSVTTLIDAWILWKHDKVEGKTWQESRAHKLLAVAGALFCGGLIIVQHPRCVAPATRGYWG